MVPEDVQLKVDTIQQLQQLHHTPVHHSHQPKDKDIHKDQLKEDTHHKEMISQQDHPLDTHQLLDILQVLHPVQQLAQDIQALELQLMLLIQPLANPSDHQDQLQFQLLNAQDKEEQLEEDHNQDSEDKVELLVDSKDSVDKEDKQAKEDKEDKVDKVEVEAAHQANKMIAKKEITQLFLENQTLITQSTQKFQKHLSIVTNKNSLDTTLMLKLVVKFSTFVL